MRSGPRAPGVGDPRRVAIVHDWLTGMRGGEKVLEAICSIYPGATLFTLVRVPGSVSEGIEAHPIRTSFAQRLPRAGRWYRHYLPLYPAAVEMFDLDAFDLVISSSHCAVKSVITRGDATHVCYCHSPMRYAWDQFGAYFGPAQVGKWPSRALRPVMAGLARWDAATAGRVDRFLANSQYVAGRIGRYYNRRSSVVYPPVDTDFYRPADGRHSSKSGALVVSALVPYKRIDVAIEAARLTGIPLRIVGQGPEESRLRAAAAGAPVEFLGWRRDDEIRDLYRGAAAVLLPGTEDFGIVPVEAQACGTPIVAFAEGGARETVVDGVTGALVTDRSPAAFADALASVVGRQPDADLVRANAERFSIAAFKTNFQTAVYDAGTTQELPVRRRRPAMMRRYNRLLVAFYIISDAVLAMAGFMIAYWLRFYSGLPVPKGIPPFAEYLTLLPIMGAIVPAAFHIQGIYRLRRGRSRVDDFFAVFVGTVLAVVLGVGGTLYFRTYWLPDELKDAGAYEIAQGVWGLFVLVNVVLTYLSREIVREALERRWKAGIGLKRVLIAGAGDLGRMVADKVLQHRELGFQVVGFVDDRAGDHIGYRGLPLLGTLPETDEIIRRERIDHVYVALPLEEHVKMLALVETTNREGVDVHVVPDLLQFIALRARLENLDGVPIISLNDVPLRGFNSILKRLIDVSLSGAALLLLSPLFVLIAALIRYTSKGVVFYTQERMGLDGKAFHVLKFRSMYVGAEDDTGPVWARDEDPRCTPVGKWLRKLDLDELPQLWNVLRGDMSIVGPRPERPYFVEQFKHRIPQYMLRHKVKAGITGWAQVNGWRGNTSLEKRIEYDLYYIENWSVGLDIKIMWLTVIRGFHRHAF